MTDYLVKEEQLLDIANAIRSKTGTTSGIETAEMASAITSIQTGSSGYEGFRRVVTHCNEILTSSAGIKEE